jgi:hypothetical protein
MKKIAFIQSIAAIMTGLVVCFASTQRLAAGQVPDDGLAVGEKWQVDEGLELTFMKVVKDTRRPAGSTGLGKTDAVVLLRAKMKYQRARFYEVSLKDYSGVYVFPDAIRTEKGKVTKQRYFVNLYTLSPRPQAGVKIRQKDYRLRLYAGLERIIRLPIIE